MKDFDKELKEYSLELEQGHYPHSEEELDKTIRRAIWSDTAAIPELPSFGSRRRWLWPSVAAACIAAVLLPLGLRASGDDDIKSTQYEGKQVYFACNNGCSLESTLESFNTLLR